MHENRDGQDAGPGASEAPLSGFRIVDFTMNMAGPFATQILGDQGADVIKIEPLAGDVVRTIGPQTDDVSAYFANLNRSKRMVCLDYSRDRCRPVIERLVASADVVVTSFRPEVARRLRLDAASLRNNHPSLIHAEVRGFGEAGPFAGRPAYDHVIQALSGFAAIQQGRSSEPALVRHGIVDKATGLAMAQAVTAALLRRARTGEGQSIALNMLDVALGMLWPDGMMADTILEPAKNQPTIANSFRLTATADGHVAVMIVTAKQWQRAIDALAISNPERMATGESRMRNGGEVMRELASKLGELSTSAAVELLANADLPVAPVVALADLHRHPQVQAIDSVREFEHPVAGRIRQANPMPRLAGQPGADQLRPADHVGAHTTSVLSELGIDPAELEALHHDGVIRTPTVPAGASAEPTH